MLNCPLKRGSLQLKGNYCPTYPVSGIIGMSGRAVGTIVLSVSESVALKATSTMLMAGSAKGQLEEYKLSISLPGVVIGKNHVVRFPSSVTPIFVPFECEWGSLALEVGLKTADVEEAALAAANRA